MKTFEDITASAKRFRDERDWEQFQTPKNLTMALSVEAAELLEHFQWLEASERKDLSSNTLAAIADEIADVQLYLVLLADRLGIDIPSAVASKIVVNAQKYPADKVRGSARKYSDYPDDAE